MGLVLGLGQLKYPGAKQFTLSLWSNLQMTLLVLTNFPLRHPLLWYCGWLLGLAGCSLRGLGIGISWNASEFEERFLSEKLITVINIIRNTAGFSLP